MSWKFHVNCRATECVRSTGTKFVHDMAQVGFNRLLADKQKLTDFLIAVPRSYIFENFAFAQGERLI
jgi:hypothetical protein